MEKYVNYLVKWLQEQVSASKTSGIILGVSGGIDSAVVAALIKKAFPNDSKGVILPCYSNQQDVDDALIVVNDLALSYDIIKLDSTLDSILANISPSQLVGASNLALSKANLKARLRMNTLYYLAQSNNYLVCGTDNACEWYTGYFTKYGDGGVDIAPLIHLSKTQVYEMARYLNIDEAIINKAPSAGLIEDQNDEDEMQVTYAELEAFMRGETVSKKAQTRIEFLHQVSAHKRDGIVKPEAKYEDIV